MAFCRNCGAQMGEGENFCPKCGQSTGAPVNRGNAPAGAPVRANAGGDLINNCIGYLKDFFSKRVLDGARRARESKGFEGIVFLGLFFLVFAFSVPVFFHELFGGIMRSAAGVAGAAAGMYISEALRVLLPFGSLLGLSCLVALICMAIVIGAVFLHARVVLKKNVNIMQVLNLVGYSMIPVIIALLANMILGLITPFLPIITLAAAVFMQCFILVNAIRELDDSGSPNLFMSTVFFVASFALIALFSYLIYKGFILSSVGGTLMKELGGSSWF